jgi:hypothetical protein
MVPPALAQGACGFPRALFVPLQYIEFHRQHQQETRMRSNDKPPARRTTVAQLAAAVGIGERALYALFARGCPRDSAAAIIEWRRHNMLAPKNRQPEMLWIDPREIALKFAIALKEDVGDSPLLKRIDRDELEDLLVEPIRYLCDLFDPLVESLDRAAILREAGLKCAAKKN